MKNKELLDSGYLVKSLRTGFATNSSSVHNIILGDNDISDPMDYANTDVFEYEFGWARTNYTNPEEIVSYAALGTLKPILSALSELLSADLLFELSGASNDFSSMESPKDKEDLRTVLESLTKDKLCELKNKEGKPYFSEHDVNNLAWDDCVNSEECISFLVDMCTVNPDGTSYAGSLKSLSGSWGYVENFYDHVGGVFQGHPGDIFVEFVHTVQYIEGGNDN